MRWLAIALFTYSAWAEQLPAATITDFVLGTHYQQLVPEQNHSPEVLAMAVPLEDRPQVWIFFNYGCAACYHFKGIIDSWVTTQPKSLVVRQIPAVFNKSWEILARAYYTLLALKIEHEIGPKIYAAIHTAGQVIYREEDLFMLLQDLGVDMVAFKMMYSSFAVSMEMQKALAVAKKIKVAVSPLFVIRTPKQAYYLAPSMVSGYENLFSLIESLLKSTAE